MSNDTGVPLPQPTGFQDAPTALLREQAQDLLRHAIAAEVATFLAQHDDRTAAGCRGPHAVSDDLRC